MSLTELHTVMHVITRNDMKLLDRYKACMVLSAAGDSMGYKNGSWEFCNSGLAIHRELAHLGGLEELKVTLPDWMVSDDTVLHLATAEALVSSGKTADKEVLYLELARSYKEAVCKDMLGRAPGDTTVNACHSLRPDIPKGYQIPFNPRGGGCGAAMRSMCIGLRYPRETELDDLIAVSVESGRITHHHPTGFLGSLVSALFTAYAIQGKPVKQWGHDLMIVLQKAKEYINHRDVAVQENLQAWSYFEEQWQNYLKLRGILDGMSEPQFEDNNNKSLETVLEERDKFYRSLSYCGWGGSSGHDAPMIAYDALLACGSSWSDLCSRAMFHSGDSDSTGVIAAAWWGAIYEFTNVPLGNYQLLEYKERLEKAAIALFELAGMKDV